MKTVLTRLSVLAVSWLLLSVFYYFGQQNISDLRLRSQAVHPVGVCACNSCSYVCTGICLADVSCVDTCGFACSGATGVSNLSCCSGVGSGCNALTCMNTTGLGGCPGGTGSIDDCGGVSCNYCPVSEVGSSGVGGGGGGAPSPVPTVAGCFSTCATEACRSTTCNNATCVGSCGNYCYGSLTSTSPTAPTLLLTNGITVDPGNINLSWAAGSWGQCPATATYQICVSTNSADPCVGGINLSALPSTQLSYTYVQSNVGTYYWKVGTNNGTGLSTVFSPTNSFTINSLSTFSSSSVTNSDNLSVSWDTGGKAHICKTQFSTASLPRRVKFVFTLTDLNGWANILSARMRWNGNVYNTVLSGGSGNNVTATATVDFISNNNGPSTYPIEIQVTDAGGTTAYMDTNTDWKVWDCNVAVSGKMYDSADSPLGAQCPTGEGFNTLASASMNFNYADFTPTVGSLVRVNATTDNDYSGSNIIWGKTYTAAPNADFVGGSTINRWIDLGVGTTNCGSQLTLNDTVSNPYSTTPALKIDFSTASAQSSWFQVSGGGIQALGSISAMVPSTCGADATCVGAIARTNNTMISAASISNGGCVLGNPDCQYGNPNNWYRSTSTLSSAEKFDYRYFYDRYFIGYGGGITLPASATMTNVKSYGGTGVYFINGDFTVNENNTVTVGQSLIVIAKGKISFAQGVTQSQGIFVADGGMLANGTNAGALLIEGSLYSGSSMGDITLSRTFVDPIDNNNKPSVLVTYRPDLMFNLPGSLLKVLSGWRQN